MNIKGARRRLEVSKSPLQISATTIVYLGLPSFASTVSLQGAVKQEHRVGLVPVSCGLLRGAKHLSIDLLARMGSGFQLG